MNIPQPQRMLTNNEFIYFLSRNQQMINLNSNNNQINKVNISNYYPNITHLSNFINVSSHFNKPYIHYNKLNSGANIQNNSNWNVVFDGYNTQNRNTINSNQNNNKQTNNFTNNKKQQNYKQNTYPQIEEEKEVKIVFPDKVTTESTEMEKWLAARKRNFPYLGKESDIEKKKEDLVEKGLISKLELKLREKIKVINRLNGKTKKKQVKKEFENLKMEVNSKFRTEKLSVKPKSENKEKVESKRSLRRQRRKLKIKNKYKNEEITDEPEDGEIIVQKEKSEIKVVEEKEKDIEDIVKDGDKEDLTLKKEIKTNVSGNNNTGNKIKYSFSYNKNNILNDLFKDESNKELGVLLQAFYYFNKENLLDN